MHGNYDCHGLLGSVSMVSVTIYGFLGLIYSSQTEPFSAQACPKQVLHVTSRVTMIEPWNAMHSCISYYYSYIRL